MQTIDRDFILNAFPALSQGQVYLDNAGGSQISRHVVERMTEFLYSANVQLGAGYGTSVKAGEMVHQGRQAVATLLNAARPEEIVLGATATQLFDQLARALVQTWAPGDEIIVTDFDHEANIGPWRRLESQGIVVREWKMPKGAHLPDLADLAALLSDKTRLVALTHASNIHGSILPIRDIADAVHDVGAQICVDGVAYAPHRAVDVRGLDVDYYGFSIYKTYGAHFAALYGRYDALLAAGNINHSFYPNRVPQKIEPGNASHELAYSCTGVIAYLEDFARAHGINERGRAAVEAAFAIITAHEQALSERLLSYLRDRPDVTIVGDPSADGNRRVPTVSFVIDAKSSRAVVDAIDPTGIGIRFGDFYSRRLVQSLDLGDADGVIRVSAVHYNTLDEIDALIALLDKL